MKRILSVLLCLSMMLGLATVVYAEDSKFTDVKSDAWYYNDVNNAVKLGIINGKSDTTFAPNDNLTYAEAVKLAACMYQLYKEGSVFLTPGGDSWYDSYVSYCKSVGIIIKDYSWGEKVTRAGYMEIFANALPDEALKAVNSIPDDAIPDVPSSVEYAPAVYKLYRAGILTGVDADHNCNPSSTIMRCEVAAIITRMMDESKRVHFSMGTEPPIMDEPVTEEPEVPQETPDMYEPLEIVVQPKNIPDADEGNVLQYTVKASGGKTPYTYTWGYRSRYESFGEIEQSEYAWGMNTNTLHLLFDLNNPYTGQIYCKVTDALGQTVSSDKIQMPEKAFIFRPESVTKDENGYLFVGRVEKGSIRVGEHAAMSMPIDGVQGYGLITDILMFNKHLDEAVSGDHCGIRIEKLSDFPYATFVKECVSEQVLEYLSEMGSFGFQVPLKGTFEYDVIEQLGEVAVIRMHAWGGTPPYSYQWYKREGSSDYEVLTSDEKYTVKGYAVDFIVDADEFEKNIYYRCDVTDAAGNTLSKSYFGVKPTAIPYISQQPKDVYADTGDVVTFTVGTRCTDAAYQWYIKTDTTKEWIIIEESDTWASGETSSTLKINVDISDIKTHSEFRCVVKNGEHSVASDSARIIPRSMYITKQPTDAFAVHGDTVQFTVKAEGGSHPYTYQWQYLHPSMEGYLNISPDHEWAEGENTAELSVLVDGTKLDSSIQFRCIVKDAKGVEKSSSAVSVIVSADPSVDFQTKKSSDPDYIVLLG